MPRHEAPLPNTGPADAPRTKTLRVHQSWNFPHTAPAEQRPKLARHETMRAYIVVTGMALGLLAVWAALAPFVA
jgi:hypothetical protein